MLQEFRLEKEAIIKKAAKEAEQAKIDFRAEVAKQEKEKTDQREKMCEKRLGIEKKLEEDTERFKKEKAELETRIADLEAKTMKESEQLSVATGEQDKLQKELHEVIKNNKLND